MKIEERSVEAGGDLKNKKEERKEERWKHRKMGGLTMENNRK